MFELHLSCIKALGNYSCWITSPYLVIWTLWITGCLQCIHLGSTVCFPYIVSYPSHQADWKVFQGPLLKCSYIPLTSSVFLSRVPFITPLPVHVSYIKINIMWYILCYLGPFSIILLSPMHTLIVFKDEVWSSSDLEAQFFYLLVILDTVGLITADAATTSAIHLSRNWWKQCSVHKNGITGLLNSHTTTACFPMSTESMWCQGHVHHQYLQKVCISVVLTGNKTR